MQGVRKLSSIDYRVRHSQERKGSSARSSLDTVRHVANLHGDLPNVELTSRNNARSREMFGGCGHTNYIRKATTTGTTCVRSQKEYDRLTQAFQSPELSPNKTNSYSRASTDKVLLLYEPDGPNRWSRTESIDANYLSPYKKFSSTTKHMGRSFDETHLAPPSRDDLRSPSSSISSITNDRLMEVGSARDGALYPREIDVSANSGMTNIPIAQPIQRQSLQSSPVATNQINGSCSPSNLTRETSRLGSPEVIAVGSSRFNSSPRSDDSNSASPQCLRIQQVDANKPDRNGLVERNPSRVTGHRQQTPPPPYTATAANQNDAEGRTAVVASYSSTNRGPTVPQKPPEALISFDTPHRGPHVGLMNHGNTCYMSVIFQCLRFTPSLYTFCNTSTDAPKSGKLCASLSELFRNMDKQASHHELYRNVETIRAIMGTCSSLYSGSEQQDATEFLTCMLDMLHSELKQSKTVAKCMSNGTTHDSSSNTPSSSTDSTPRMTNPGQGVQIAREVLDQLEASRPPPQSTTLKSTTPESSRRFPKWFTPRRGRKKSVVKKSCMIGSIESTSLDQCGTSSSNGTHPAILAWDEENKSEASNIRETFMSQLQTYRKCNQCNAEKLYFSVVWNLGVPIPQNTSGIRAHSGSLPITVTPHPQAELNDGKRYGGSPSIPGQSGKPTKLNILFDGSNTQEATNSNAWPKRDLSGPVYDQTNAPVDRTSSSLNSDITAHSSLTNGTQPSPLGTAPPPYSAAARPPVVAVPLKDCLNAFTLTEVLDGTDRPMCATCEKKTACVLHHSISRLPDILIIQLLRFCCGERRQKIDIPVAFDKKLNMEEYMKSEYEKQHKFPSPIRTENDHTYWLYAVVYHDGAMSYGHYTAACRTVTGDNPNMDQWYHFDDEFVKEIKSEDVHKSSAYLLFYERDSLYQKRKNTQTRTTPIKCTEGSQSQQLYETQV